MAHKQNQKQLVVVGCTGYVGRKLLTAAERKGFLTTGASRCPSRNSRTVIYDFFQTSPLLYPFSTNNQTIVFAAMVEKDDTPKVESSMAAFAESNRNSRIIYLSSDAVFSGSKGLYSEKDTLDPTSLYGRNLVSCENIIRDTCPNHCIIRPSYLYGYSEGTLDSRLQRTKDELLQGKQVSRFFDMYKSPMGIKRFAEAVIYIAASDFGGTIHIGGPRISVFNFHHTAMNLMGVATSNLKAASIPTRVSYLKDTSLDTSLWQKLSNSQPPCMHDAIDELLP